MNGKTLVRKVPALKNKVTQGFAVIQYLHLDTSPEALKVNFENAAQGGRVSLFSIGHNLSHLTRPKLALATEEAGGD